MTHAKQHSGIIEENTDTDHNQSCEDWGAVSVVSTAVGMGAGDHKSPRFVSQPGLRGHLETPIRVRKLRPVSKERFARLSARFPVYNGQNIGRYDAVLEHAAVLMNKREYLSFDEFESRLSLTSCSNLSREHGTQ